MFNDENGRLLTAFDTCQDADDVFVDPKRQRVYVSCGEGFIDVLGVHGDGYVRVGRMATAAGARTSLFVPEIDRFLLAVRATATDPAAIWVFRPVP